MTPEEEAAELLPCTIRNCLGHEINCPAFYRPAIAERLRQRNEEWAAQKLKAEKQWRDICEEREKRIAALEERDRQRGMIEAAAHNARAYAQQLEAENVLREQESLNGVWQV